jgi:hypothetical protein
MKLISKLGDGLFRFTDSFFRGSGHRLPENPDKIFQADDANCIVWELDQGFEDIFLKDLIVSINILIPAFVRKPIGKLYRKACLYFLVDAAIEEESIDPENIKSSLKSLTTSQPAKILTLFRATNEKVGTRVISMIDWLEIKLHKVSCFLRRQRPDKPYYLLGNFTPLRYDIFGDKSNFRHTYNFHMRN